MAKTPVLSSEERKKLLDAKLKSKGRLHNRITGEGFDTKNVEFMPLDSIPEIASALGDLPGFARGNLIEFIGDSGSGKTYVALKTGASCQKTSKLKVAFFNVENAFYEKRANQVGLITRDPELFELWDSFGSAEEVCDTVTDLIESELYGLIIVDSISALIPQAELDKGFTDSETIALHARLVGRFAKKLCNLTSKHKTSVILINQFRMGNSGMMFTKKPMGGEGLVYYDHYRLIFKKLTDAKGKIYNEAKELIGGKTHVTIKKNRYGPPEVETIFPVYFTEEDVNPIVNFVMVAKAKYTELIKEVGPRNNKVLQYITEDGEVIEHTDPKEFIKKLHEIPYTPKRKQPNAPTTVFEYICKQIKLNQNQIEELLQLANSDEVIKIARDEEVAEDFYSYEESN
jgi:RecA/RadA recombinase